MVRLSSSASLLAWCAAVGRSPAEVPALRLGLRLHRRADADLDAVPLAFAHAAEERHDQIASIGAGVDGATDLRHPEADAVVHEDGDVMPNRLA
jgi:hypothetical protein